MASVINEIKRVNGKVTVQRNNRIFVDVEQNQIASALYHMKLIGFNQLSIFTAVDRIAENQFELVYVLYSTKEKINCIVRSRIPRDHPVIDTVDKIYPPTHTYERELTEMFGIAVNGNPDAGKPFLLENWKDKPPMRKDFDSIKYVHSKFVFRYSEGKDE